MRFHDIATLSALSAMLSRPPLPWFVYSNLLQNCYIVSADHSQTPRISRDTAFSCTLYVQTYLRATRRKLLLVSCMTILFFLLANHQMRHHATHKVGCPPDDLSSTCLARACHGLNSTQNTCTENIIL